MAIEVRHVREGYLVTISQPGADAWSSLQPLTPAKVIAECAVRGQSLDDIKGALDATASDWRARLEADRDRHHAASAVWRQTPSAFFPWAANVNGLWWVLRLNSFPDHPLYTLFIDGARQDDIDDLPRAWVRPKTGVVPISESETVDALSDVSRFLAYGSEVGLPCDNPFCCG